MKRTILSIIILFVLCHTAMAGVTNPLPTELNLEKGETGRFKFQVQTITSNQELFCVPSFPDNSQLEVNFDEEEIIAPAGGIKEVTGDVKVPSDATFGSFEQRFCISCTPTSGESGTAVKIDTCDLPIKVNVVPEERREYGLENMTIPEKPCPLWLKTLIIAAIIIFIALLAHHFLKRHKKVSKEEIEKPAKKIELPVAKKPTKSSKAKK